MDFQLRDNDTGKSLHPAIADDIDGALDLTVKTMPLISCRSATPTIITGHVFRPLWKDAESLEAFVERDLPGHDVEPLEKIDTVKVHKLRAPYIEKYANITIEWTGNLPDHLFLQITDTWKSLRIFKHAGILEMTSRVLSDHDNISTAESLSLGCIPPALATETLRTPQLLFPEDDSKSSKFLAQEIVSKSLDPRLSTSFQLYHGLDEYPGDAALPEDVQDLFARFPYWGKRIYKLLKEIEDPTPLTWYEKWSDRRKSSRHMYWAGVIALSFALVPGKAVMLRVAVNC